MMSSRLTLKGGNAMEKELTTAREVGTRTAKDNAAARACDTDDNKQDNCYKLRFRAQIRQAKIFSPRRASQNPITLKSGANRYPLDSDAIAIDVNETKAWKVVSGAEFHAEFDSDTGDW